MTEADEPVTPSPRSRRPAPRRVAAALGLAAFVLVNAACTTASPTSPTDCGSLTASASPQLFGPTGGTGTITVAAPGGCRWTASAAAPWVAFTTDAGGTGNGTVGFRVAANPTTLGRSTSVTAGGQEVQLTQDGAPPPPGGCSYAISPANRSVRTVATNFAVMVLAPFGCGWTFASNASWLAVVPDPESPNGNGNGTVVAQVSANTDAAPRTGTAIIAGHTLTVTQDGTAAPACAYSLSRSSVSMPSSGGSGSFTLTTTGVCSWRVELSDGWLRLTTPARGSGTATVGYTVGANLGSAPRTGEVAVWGDASDARLVHTITQAGGTP